MIGRAAESALLAAEIRAARAGAGRLVVVEGPAGIGKTTLTGTAIARARDQGVSTLTARGNPLDADYAFGLARQAFAPLMDAPEWTGRCRGPAATAVPALTTAAPVDGHADAYAATSGLFWLLAHHVAAAPAVLWVDDAHWADPASLRWLVAVARRIDEFPLAMVVATRAGVAPGVPGLLPGAGIGELSAETTGVMTELLSCATTTIRLGPLDAESTAGLVRGTLPDASAGLAAACHRAAGGNPFLLAALLDHLRESGGEPDAVGVPRIGRWVEAQLTRLPDGCAGLARALAVLGPSAGLRHAAALAGVDPDKAALLTDALRAAGLLAPGDDPVLAHPIVAAALHDSLGPGERGLWHARAAELLSGDRADPERAALHLLRTPPGGAAATVRVLRAAADRATARGAPEAAATYLRRALDEPPPDPPADAAVRLDLALALAAVRRPGAAELAREVVARIDPPVRRAHAGLRTGRALALAGENTHAIALYRLGLDRPDGVPAAALALLDVELAASAWTDTRTRALATAALDRARGTTPEWWRVLDAHEAADAGRPVDECLAILDPVLLDRWPADSTESLLPTVTALALINLGQFDRVLAMADETIAAAGARGWLSAVAHGRFLRALAARAAGRCAEAAADARVALDFKLATSTPPAAVLWALSPLVDALVEADRTAEAEAALAVSCPGEPPEHVLTAPMLLQSRARLRLAQDRPAEALADLRSAAARWAAFGVVQTTLASWWADTVTALLAVGEPAEATRLAHEHLALAGSARSPGARCAALRACARVAPRDERPALLAEAVRAGAASQARLEEAYARFELGCALRRTHRAAEAREPLRAALDLATAGGADRLAARARTELHAAGARPRRTALSGPGALTASERQVADLAAAGMTNREIAARLTLSRRTIETHLAHAYRKLGITSRAGLT